MSISDSAKKGFGAVLGGCSALFLLLMVFMFIGQHAAEVRRRQKIEILASRVRVGMEYNDVVSILGTPSFNNPEPTKPTVTAWAFPNGITVITDAGKVIEVQKPKP